MVVTCRGRGDGGLPGRATPKKDRSGGRWDGGTRQALGAVVLAGRFRMLSKEVKTSAHRRRWPAGWPLGTTEAGGARGAGLCSPPVLASSPVFSGSHTCIARLPVGFADVTADLPRSHSVSFWGLRVYIWAGETQHLSAAFRPSQGPGLRGLTWTGGRPPLRGVLQRAG